ncbi:hypothetical protein RBQ61_00010 [Sedimentibacter sp. MB35-C1]|uniref:hypothetical protein n=1 Tax=Sedimentibacter sp. MB35-C1 TaxID=3070995 RepID=UPI0027DF6903|nr:hypothetical protein [Sedimentibacter sp. MB35-C1]WMJ77354.1 hypothetical protein RBQ61_00010 [Sedimentibacter sp. MB35-C1]
MDIIGDDFKEIIESAEGTREVTTSYDDGILQGSDKSRQGHSFSVWTDYSTDRFWK